MKVIDIIKNLFKPKILKLEEGSNLERDSEREELLDLLYSKNNELYETLNEGILQRQYVEKLGTDKIEMLSLYPEIQQRILELNTTELDLFLKLLAYAQKEQNDWIPVTNDLILAVKNEGHKEIYNQFDQMSENDKWKFLNLNLVFSQTDIFVRNRCGVNRRTTEVILKEKKR